MTNDAAAAKAGQSAVLGVMRLPFRAASAMVDAAERVPLAGSVVRDGRRAVHTAIESAEALATVGTRTGLAALIREVVDAFTSEIDLTALVLDNVDLDRIIASVDMNAIVDLLDLDAIVARVDLDAAVARVDLDAAVARVDLDAAVARVDVDKIIDRVDVDRVISRVDIEAVIAGVDLDAVIDTVDLDRAVSHVDIDAVINRVDLIGLADVIIDGVDLPGIIREASTSVTSDVMTDVRSTSERADDAVADMVGRLLRRRVVAEVESGERD
ncbi:hypothetical protein [Gordonia otitidis]|uniref:Uncharacterized protein n=1 Tax=Gordonia otitidis (strain DSM 44809 / CCUG 52243 / JCM 12355 / NBRC 100426 / IFM 10032) TaxID=1108044 RepID=H5TLR5_GORO1|nr:hypothetical protein [Gordonia otitidis]UEA60016.1 hypothetical protein LK459_03790 [Gordonia otitidis]GAB34423.1 hypothetical protein GOOTI_108_00150 [Gordonia otitidis NBRC 100426]